jgi:sulfite oxidase
VGRPLELSLGDLRDRFGHHDVVAALQCAGNRRAGLLKVRDIPGEAPWGPGATGNARWTGVRLADVLAAAVVAADAEHVAFAAPDISDLASPPQPFGASIPLGKAMRGEVLLAWAMNGQPLPRVHGAPVRVVVPGYIGARSVKWVEQVTVQARPSDNHFQATAYRLLPAEADPAAAGPGDGLSLGPIAVNADILSPGEQACVPAGLVTVSGYALAGDDRRVARVDVS